MAVPEAPVALSPREREVLAALGEHLTNAEIAARLFLSPRTVESHVAALLRKTGSASRKELARLAQEAGPPVAAPAATVPLTSFIGRASELAALAEALRTHRLVTALGPGGVGKTRLALAVVAALGDRYERSVVVDLVPVMDPSRLAAAVAAALGVPQAPGQPLTDAITDRLGGGPVLLVLDNCEHLVDAAATFAEALLGRAPGLTVLATSRVRLAVPFEQVFHVPGMSVSEDGGGDAVALFLARASAAGAGALDPSRVAAICSRLDGLALAIELAAARVAALGLDGLETGLEHRLDLLGGDRRTAARHRSVRAALDWSIALLSAEEAAVLRRVSVFAAPFQPGMAARLVDGWAPASPERVPAVLADLVDASLLTAEPGVGGGRLRCLETVRQYGAEQLAATGERDEAWSRHLAWCEATLDGVTIETAAEEAVRATIDGVADEAFAALQRSWASADDRAAALRLARRFGDAALATGAAAEAQRAYERAADLAGSEDLRAELLDRAADAAEARQLGDDALALRAASTRAALHAGLRGFAARQLARSADILNRTGMTGPQPPDGVAAALLRRARELAPHDARAMIRARIAELAEVYAPGAAEEAEVRRLADEAHRLGAHEEESAALDLVEVARLAADDVAGAQEVASRRLAALSTLPPAARSRTEVSHAMMMALESHLAVGALLQAAALVDPWQRLHADASHLAASRPMLVTALVGDLRGCVALGRRFLEGWSRSGRPPVKHLAICPPAAAAAAELAGEPALASRLLATVPVLSPDRDPVDLIWQFFLAVAPLHRGEHEAALTVLAAPPDGPRNWFDGLWRPWYAAAWAEAGVLAGEDGPGRVARARPLVPQNRVAALLLERAAALAGIGGRMADIADALDAAGARYQAARTRVMAGGDLGERGRRELAALGAVPMAWPPG